jgi:starch synthase (maltosyl-transferring)
MSPKIYYIQPQLIGPLTNWPPQLKRCRDMGFDHVCLAPPFRPGATGDVFLAADHERVHAAFGTDDAADQVLGRLAEACRRAGLTLLLDLVIDRIAADHALVAAHRGWFRAQRPTEDHLPDPRISEPDRQGAYARLEDASVAAGYGDWWCQRLQRLTSAGIAGFRCLFPDQVPASLWRRLAETTGARLYAWTPGIGRGDLGKLDGAGFAAVFSSAAWWDGRSGWLVEEHEALRPLAPVIAVVEAPFAKRLSEHLGPNADLVGAYRHALDVAAGTGCGMLVPIGFEYALRRPLDRAQADSDTFNRLRAEAQVDLCGEIKAANETVDRLAALSPWGEMRMLTTPARPVTALLRADHADVRDAEGGVVTLVNPDLDEPRTPDISLAPLPPAAG